MKHFISKTWQRIAVAGCLAAWAWLALPPRAAAAAEPIQQQQEATLEELLINGLKVRTPQEKAFIAGVVKVVSEGKLSESLVKAIYQRARQQHRDYPYPYFVAIMRQVARQYGVQL